MVADISILNHKEPSVYALLAIEPSKPHGILLLIQETEAFAATGVYFAQPRSQITPAHGGAQGGWLPAAKPSWSTKVGESSLTMTHQLGKQMRWTIINQVG